VPAQDTGAEMRALGLMIIIALLMGVLVLVFKSDYRLRSNWESNLNYYPNVQLPKEDPLRRALGASAEVSSQEGEEPVSIEELHAAALKEKQSISANRPDIEATPDTDPRLDPDYDGDDRLPANPGALTGEASPVEKEEANQ